MAKIEKSIQVRCNQGLHARPAAVFVQKADQFDSKVIVEKDGEQVNGKSIMGVLMLGAHQDSYIKLIIEGEDAEACMLELEKFLGKNE